MRADSLLECAQLLESECRSLDIVKYSLPVRCFNSPHRPFLRRVALLVRPPCMKHRMLGRITAFPCILYLYQRPQVRLDGHFCAVHAVTDMP